MPTSRSSTDRTERVSMRASRSQKAVIERAAAAVDKNMTDFVLEAAAAQAEKVLADRRWFSLDEDAFNRFVELLDAPVQDLPKLRETLAAPTVFETQAGA